MNQSGSSILTNYHGVARQQRGLDSLMPEFIKVDERSTADLLAFASAYAKYVKFYDLNELNLSGHEEEEDTSHDWSSFFNNDSSVFLANLMSTDIQTVDERVHAGLVNVNKLTDENLQRDNFIQLVDDIVMATDILFNWQTDAHGLNSWTEKSKIILELDRALEGDLGYYLHAFCRGLSSIIPELSLVVSKEKQWKRKIEEFESKNSYALLKRGPVVAGVVNTRNDLTAKIVHTSSLFQEYYHKLYFTLAYLKETAPGLLEQSLTEKDDHAPNLGLFISFLKLFSCAQDELNRLTQRHFDYYYEKVLQLKRKGCQPDWTIVGFALSDHSKEHRLPRGTKLLAGVNADGLASYYATQQSIKVTRTQVAALKSLFMSKHPIVKTGSSYRLVTSIYAAPVANSADGQGAPFITDDDHWPIIGEDQFDRGQAARQMTDATVGFVVASSTLLLGEGERAVVLTFRFTTISFANLTNLVEDIAANAGASSDKSSVFARLFGHPFKVFLSGEEKWIEVEKYSITPPDEGKWGESFLKMKFYLRKSDPAISGYSRDVHGGVFETKWPVLKVILSNTEPIYAYSFLRDLELEKLSIDVSVEGLRGLTVYNDQGLLDASSPFAPFGPYPRRNSYFLFGHTELFNKELQQVTVDLEWGNLPEEEDGFAGYFATYGQEIRNEDYRFQLSALTDYVFKPRVLADQDSFPMFDYHMPRQPALSPHTQLKLDPTHLKKLKITPSFGLNVLEEYNNSSRTGYFKLGIDTPPIIFGHQAYPRVFAQRMAENARPRPFSIFPTPEEELQLPNEPYTPIINRLTVNYRATTTINFRQLEYPENSESADNQLYRLHPFGLETIFSAQQRKQPFLLPQFDEDGYLFIGLKELHPPETISLFFDIEDSKKNFQRSPIQLQWEYLNKDHWIPFEADQLLSDTTYGFSTAGIVSIHCNEEISLGSQLLDPDLHWIRATGLGNMEIPGRCRRVITQVVKASWVDNGDPTHLETPPQARAPITNLENNDPEIATLFQVHPFEGGVPAESLRDFYIRSSERLRHKGRAVNLWDVEHLILDQFPEVYQAKCIGREGNEQLLSIGEVVVVVVPKILPDNATPKVGFHLLREIEQYVQSIASPFAKISVINPVYERLVISGKIKLKPGFERERGYWHRKLVHSILNFVCPWLEEGFLSLGGSINKNEVYSMLSEHPGVDFVTAFSMAHVFEKEDDHFDLKDTAIQDTKLEVLAAAYPWSVIVPADQHHLIFLDQDGYELPIKTAYDEMRLETDFIVMDDEARPEDFSTENTERADEFELPDSWLGL